MTCALKSVQIDKLWLSENGYVTIPQVKNWTVTSPSETSVQAPTNVCPFPCDR